MKHVSTFVAGLIRRCLENPNGVLGEMADHERRAGFVVGEGVPVRLSSQDWEPGLLTFDPMRGEVRIVCIFARVERAGAFRRLLDAIASGGYRPVVIEPVGLVMTKIMRRWGWVCTRVDTGFEQHSEWRPTGPRKEE